jgi:hypothetical protein
MPLNRASSSSLSPRVATLPLVFVLSCVGCGTGQYTGPVYPVKGQVLLANGKPLTSGSIQFIPKPGGLLASGKLDKDGNFSLESLDKREGAAPGEYKVRIEPSLEMTAPKRGKSQPLPFATKYRDDDGDTGLTATVKSEPTQLEPFRLDLK